LADLLVDCPVRAATRVFDTAIQERVDFVLLAGDVIDLAHCSPHEWSFLVEQFLRLAERNIAVYWAGGKTDSRSEALNPAELPKNVHRFPSDRVERYIHESGGQAVCEIAGASRSETGSLAPYRFSAPTPDRFSIALVHADWECSALDKLDVDYWALGGSHGRRTFPESHALAHDAGSPQGRSPLETGPHGCTLVAVDEHRHPRLTSFSTDLVRWYSPRLSVSDIADRHELERALRERTQHLIDESGGATLLVTWVLSGEGPLTPALRRGTLSADMLTLLQATFGQKSGTAWTIDVTFELPERMPESWMKEDTIRGDYLRLLRDRRGEQESFAPDARSWLLPVDERMELIQRGCIPALVDESAFRRATHDAAWLGADLLSPEEAVR
jgi:DNA repair exonuclease SbcCD nuclease subunit